MPIKQIAQAVLLLVAAGLCPAASAITTQLPQDVSPRHYDITLTPDATGSVFSASETVTIDVKQPLSVITLNALDLSFRRAVLTGEDGKGTPQEATVMVDAATQTASFHFAGTLQPGSYRLAMDYEGKISRQAFGLFSLDYDANDGKDGDKGRKRALFTQFENSDARRMIPSWDEPQYKATFTLDAVVPAGLMAISNMPIAQQSAADGGKVRVHFAESPKMSTYLLFFGLGEFDRAKASADGVELGVVTRKGVADQAAYVLDSSRAILHEYDDYFGVHYPLPKLDNVAGPGGSEFFSAMENWGAIFSFERSMLFDPAISTQRDRREIFTTAAHEMAHQWFGDLVTMQWWDDLWLNEGFASWMEARTTARLHPEWDSKLDAIRGRDYAMGVDATRATHPVVQHIDTVEQASEAFDSITYDKGQAVIGMLENYVGADVWRDGVRSYMKAHAYGNTSSDDFWREIDRAAGRPVSVIAHDFTLHGGVPAVSLAHSACHDGKTEVELVQGEFTRDPDAANHQTWHVPVRLAVLGAQPVQTLFDGSKDGGKTNVTLPGCGPVVLNAGQFGYYRSLYDAQNFAALKTHFGELSSIDQLGILSDTMALGLAGRGSAANFLELVDVLPQSADSRIWSDVSFRLEALYRAYGSDDASQAARRRFADYAIARLGPIMTKTGWEAKPGEDEGTTGLRANLIGTLGLMGDPGIVAEARRRFNAGLDATPVELRSIVAWVVAVHADGATWDALHAKARGESSRLAKERFMMLLGQSEDQALAQRALQLALSDEIDVTMAAALIREVAQRHPDLAFDFALAHRADVDRLVDSASGPRYFPRLAAASSDPAMIAKLQSYAKAHIAPSAMHDTDLAVENIGYRIRIRQSRLPEIDNWLRHHG